jgi:hypothetical protein
MNLFSYMELTLGIVDCDCGWNEAAYLGGIILS